MDDDLAVGVSTDGFRVIVWAPEAGAAIGAWEVIAPVNFVMISPRGSS